MDASAVVRLKPAATCALIAMFVASGFGRTVLAQQAGELDPRIVALVASVSEERLGATLKKLENL